MTPAVAPEHFYDHEVIVKAFLRVHVGALSRSSGFVELHRLTPCGLTYLMW
jgi:hypothetical protein